MGWGLYQYPTLHKLQSYFIFVIGISTKNKDGGVSIEKENAYNQILEKVK